MSEGGHSWEVWNTNEGKNVNNSERPIYQSILPSSILFQDIWFLPRSYASGPKSLQIVVLVVPIL